MRTTHPFAYEPPPDVRALAVTVNRPRPRGLPRPVRSALAGLLWRVTYKVASLLAAGVALAGACAFLGCTALKDQVAAPRDNERLGRQVAEQLFADGLSDRADIQVGARAGVVTLHGRVPTDGRARLAAESAARVRGVSRVDNRLRVDERAGDGDKHRRTLIEDVREALEQSLPRRGPRLLVESEDGVVYLSGIVPDARTRATAVTIALNIPGVHHVEDNLLNERP